MSRFFNLLLLPGSPHFLIPLRIPPSPYWKEIQKLKSALIPPLIVLNIKKNTIQRRYTKQITKEKSI